MSEKPYVQHFEMPDGRAFASVVMDQSEFETLIDELVAVGVGLTPEMAVQVKEIGHVPMMGRGSKTEFVFERYGVECDLMSMIIRGRGRQLAEKLIASAEEQIRRQIESN